MQVVFILTVQGNKLGVFPSFESAERSFVESFHFLSGPYVDKVQPWRWNLHSGSDDEHMGIIEKVDFYDGYVKL